MTSTAAPRPPLDPTRLSSSLAPYPGLTPELLDHAPSSNAVAAERARAGAPDGHLVVLDHQTAGRGRLDRGWESPRGTSVTFSLLLRPDLPPSGWPWLPLLTGHVVAGALTAAGYDARVKWPNDVLLPERKVAGILVERIDTPTGPAAVLGVGLNVTNTEEELPVPTAISLHVARPEVVPDRTDLLVTLAIALREEYDAWLAGGDGATERLAAAYARDCATVGQAVRVELPGGGTLTGRAVDVDPDGMLVVETPNGRERVGAGDVVHVRPDDDAEVR